MPLKDVVSAGACSDWQTWQVVSGLPLCWCRKLPPPAKYSSARHKKAALIRRKSGTRKFVPTANISSAYTPIQPFRRGK